MSLVHVHTAQVLQILVNEALNLARIMHFKSLSLQCVLTICLAVNAQAVCIHPSEQSHLSTGDCISFESLFKRYEVWSPGTSVEFSFGIYSLPNDTNISSLSVRDTSDISLLGDTSFGPAIIDCDGRLSFTFINVTNLTIVNIQFIQCGAPVNVIEMQTDSIPPGTEAAHFLVNIHMLFMTNVSISSSHGYGMLCVNLYGESHIVKTNFTYNGYDGNSPVGGSVFLLYEDATICPSDITWISISDVFFYSSLSTYDAYKKYYDTKASCLEIVIKRTCCFIHVGVDQSVFAHNFVPTVAIYDLNMSASYEIVIQGSNFSNSHEMHPIEPMIATILYTSTGDTNQNSENTHSFGNTTIVRDICISDCVFSDVQMGEQTRFGYIGIRLFFNVSITIEKCIFLPNIIQYAIAIQPKLEAHSGKLISIDECTFTGLKFGAITISYRDHKPLNIKIAKSIFSNISDKVLSISKKSPGPNDQLSVFIANTTFTHNSHQSLFAVHVNNLTLAGNKFTENDDTPIACRGSKIYFSGTTYIVGNKGNYGGALFLSTAIYSYRCSNKWEVTPPVLYLHSDARLILMNNKASNKGGAIYVGSTSNLYHQEWYNLYNIGYDYYEPCFYQLASLRNILEYHQKKAHVVISRLPKITFTNNTAVFAGDSIFGGLYEHCSLEKLTGRIKFEDFINISHPLSPSEMAGDPNMICLCVGSVANCSHPQLPLSTTLYQGQSFRVYAIATRAKNHYANYGATPALVNTWIDQSRFDARLGKGQSAHKLDNKCSEIVFSIYSREPHVEVEITSSGETINRIIAVNLLGCPFGFQLMDSRYPGCVCDSTVKESGCTCDIDNLTISCPFGKWIGNISHNTIVHHHCPFDYCTSERVIEITDALDDQCAHNRSGTLCGECQPELSLVLGNSKCKHCSNMHLFLILLFVMAGLSLVLILYGCNLTVSRGTVNGLIYFANVIQVNSSIFVTPSTSRFLTVFIAWVNLDLGFQTCFFNGMDMYAKAWLQFIFPVYIWLIVAAIVLLSKHSMTVSRLTRDNTVPVLATLFLLSYAKLLRTTITAFSFTYLRYPDGTRLAVWMYDGNVPFVKGKHIALFIVAHVAVFGFILPYTLLLLLSPYLQRWSHYKPLRWVNKLKPFLDANHGPYKNKIRNWTGIILLIRTVQFTSFAANAEGDPNINLMVILLVGVAPYLVIWIFGTVYKSKANSILESAFILLLSTLASASLYIRTTSLDVEGKQTAITTSIFAAAFSLFLVIIAYHSFKLIKSTISKLTKLTKHGNFLHTITPDKSATNLSSEPVSDQKLTAPTVSYVALSELVSHTDDEPVQLTQN